MHYLFFNLTAKTRHDPFTHLSSKASFLTTYESHTYAQNEYVMKKLILKMLLRLLFHPA